MSLRAISSQHPFSQYFVMGVLQSVSTFLFAMGVLQSVSQSISQLVNQLISQLIFITKISVNQLIFKAKISVNFAVKNIC